MMSPPRGTWLRRMAGGDSLVAHRGVVGQRNRDVIGSTRTDLSRSYPHDGRDNGPVQRPKPSSIPQTPGSYQFKDARGRIIYVGKAKSLRSRVMSYFGSGLAERTRQMVAAAETV